MCGNSECVCRALTWISLPIWLPIYAIAAPTYQCGGQIWRSYVRPAGKYSVPKPLPRRRVIRHQLSLAKLPKVETKAPPAAVAAGGAKQCGFWKLPIEIRMMIWKELLLLEYGGAVEVRLTPKRRDGFRLYSYDAFRNLETTILRVSRQL